MAKGLVIAGAIALLGGGGVLGYGMTRPASNVVVDSTKFVEEVATLISEKKIELRNRVEAIAKEQKVQAGLAADAATAVDLRKEGELNLKLLPGEQIEFGQTSATGALQLLTIPDNAVFGKHSGKPSDTIAAKDNGLVIGRVAAVQLAYTTVAPAGYVYMLQPLPISDFDGIAKRLTQAATGIALSIEGKRFVLGTLPADTKTATAPLQGEPAIVVETAVATAGGGKLLPFLIGGGAGLGLGLLLVILGLTGKRSAVAPGIAPNSVGMPLGQTNPTLTPSPAASGAMSMPGLAAGTPSAAMRASTGGVTPTTLGPGGVIGKWEILSRLGSGGMADVFKAKSLGEAGFAKTVALKVMHAHLARSQRAVDHFLDEARLASQIHHANVVQIIDLGRIGDEYAIVMEYIDGVDLDHLLQRSRAQGKQVPLAIALGILRRICDGLAAAHNASSPEGQPLQIVHRDVKSANVLLSKQGQLKVVDFGIAKAAVQSHFTVAGETKGTPSMMAPEQRLGEIVDIRADVYSLGAVGYEILAGAAVNLDLAAIAHLGLDGWPHLPKPTSLRAELPAELDSIILGTLSYDRGNRPASCEVLESQLEQVCNQYGLAATDKEIGRWVVGVLSDNPYTEETTEVRDLRELPA